MCPGPVALKAADHHGADEIAAEHKQPFNGQHGGCADVCDKALELQAARAKEKSDQCMVKQHDQDA
jgi:hypothetical protein